LCEVAALVASAGADAETVAAAFLHDTIEDQGASVEQISEAFGSRIAGIVAELTDDKSLPKARRKELQLITAPKKSPEASVVKWGDKISNVRAIAVSPPPHWSTERRLEYLAWARTVVCALPVKPPILVAHFNKAVEDAHATLNVRDVDG